MIFQHHLEVGDLPTMRPPAGHSIDIYDTFVDCLGWFVEQMLMLSSWFRCDQIYNNNCYFFGHTVVLLKSDLDVQQTHLWGWFDEQKLMLRRHFS